MPSVGLLDYYRQFEAMPVEEVNEGLREEAAERRRKALARVETLDLSQTTWMELPHVRIVNAITYANRPTGELMPVAELRRLLDGVPDGVAVLLDEALVEFADAQPTNASLSLLEDHPRLLIFRSFSKAWGLAGLRVGYALGGPGSEEVLAELAPDLGVSDASQSGALEALRSCSELIASRVRALCEERPRLEAALRNRGFEVT